MQDVLAAVNSCRSTTVLERSPSRAVTFPS